MYLTKDKFDNEMKKISQRNESFELRQKLNDAKKYTLFKLPSTSKLVLAAVFIMCIEIVIFCEYLMCRTGDTSAMYALIGVPTTLVPIVISYYSKSTKENTKGGIVYDSAMAEIEDGPQG